MNSTELPPDIAGSVRAVLEERYGLPVSIISAELLVSPDWGRSTVWRSTFSFGDSTDISVVVKKSNLGGLHGANEAWCLKLLEQLNELGPHVPRLIGSDAANSVLVLSDLGSIKGNRLADIMECGDLAQVRSGLQELMRLTGKLNGLTCADAHSMGPADRTAIDPENTGHASWRLGDHSRRIPRVLREAGIGSPDGVADEIARVATLLEDPAGFTCLVHGDICPSNAALVNGRLVLYDFEMANPRLITVDGAWARMRCLRCFNGLLLSDQFRRELEAAWRESAGKFCPALLDDAVYNPLMGAAVCGWLGAMLDWLPGVLAADKERDRLTDRLRMLAALESAEQSFRELGGMPLLAAICGEVHRELGKRWPDEAEQLATLPRL